MRQVKNVGAFLRSINIRFDADAPERIAHFHPTSKSVALIQRLMGLHPDRATLVVAPYGTGKSLAAAYALHALENRPESRRVLRAATARLAAVCPDTSTVIVNRLRSSRQALVLALSGFVPSLSEALRDAACDSSRRLGRPSFHRRLARITVGDSADPARVLIDVRRLAATEGLDRVVVVWDEFGRHLEAAIAAGRGSSLHDAQVLAETAARSVDPASSVALLMHRGLMHYAASLPQVATAEWKKVEGRFETLQYVDDSREIYRLIAEVCAAARGRAPTLDSAAFFRLAAESRELGIFRDFTERDLAKVLELAWPLNPATLYLLPRLAARVAQNERTLFGFLHAQTLREPIFPAALYDYFSPSMQADTGPGGTFKQWLETQSAIGKAGECFGGPEILKAACLLGLGASGERSRTTRRLLLYSVRGPGFDTDGAIEELIGRKLLLHRRHSDELTVWHGTDLDLRGRLEDEKTRLRGDFLLVPFLMKEFPPACWRPVRYNDDFGVRRYFAGEYVDVARIDTLYGPELPLAGNIPTADGWIKFLVAETADQLRSAVSIAETPDTGERVVVAMPSQPLMVTDAALELACLLRMSVDSDLVGSDPLVGGELQQMIDDARAHVATILGSMTAPTSGGPRWFHRGREWNVATPSDLRARLSDVASTVYPLTPRIFNEMIVRRRPSAVVVNARKKLLMGILERAGMLDLGLKGQFPDASMLRTVLIRTGLYVPAHDGEFRFAQVEGIKDAGLAAVWKALELFFTAPADRPKPAAEFLGTLTAPPYGVREGLLPILIAAAFRAFPTSVVLQRDGEYVRDVLPSDIELLCREPARFSLLVLSLDRNRHEYLLEVLRAFNVAMPPTHTNTELMRLAFDVVHDWARQLPPGAWTSSTLSEGARLLGDALQQETDPVALFFRRIPRACRVGTDEDLRSVPMTLEDLKSELACVLSSYRASASLHVRRTMQLTDRAVDADLGTVVRSWAACFDDRSLATGVDTVARGLVQRCSTHYASDDALLDSLSTLLVGKSFARWDDSAAIAFERELTSVVRRIEEFVASDPDRVIADPTAAARLATLVGGRLRSYYSTYAHLAGRAAAEELITELLDTASRRRKQLGNDR